MVLGKLLIVIVYVAVAIKHYLLMVSEKYRNVDQEITDMEEEEIDTWLDFHNLEEPQYIYAIDEFGYIGGGLAVIFWSYDTKKVYKLSTDVIFLEIQNRENFNVNDYLVEITELPERYYPLMGIYPKTENFILLPCYYARYKDFMPVVLCTIEGLNLYIDRFYNYSVNRDSYYAMLEGFNDPIVVKNVLKVFTWTNVVNNQYIDVELGGTIFDYFTYDNFGYSIVYGGVMSNFLYSCNTIDNRFTITNNYFNLTYFDLVVVPVVEFTLSLIPFSVSIPWISYEVNYVFVYSFSYLLPKLGMSNLIAMGSKTMIPIMTIYRFSISSLQAINVPSIIYESYSNTKIIPAVNVFSRFGFPMCLYNYFDDSIIKFATKSINEENNEIDLNLVLSKIETSYDNDSYYYVSNYTEGMFPKMFMYDEFFDFDFPFLLSSNVLLEEGSYSRVEKENYGMYFEYTPIFSNHDQFFNYSYYYDGIVSFSVKTMSIEFNISNKSITEVKNIFIGGGILKSVETKDEFVTVSIPLSVDNTLKAFKDINRILESGSSVAQFNVNDSMDLSIDINVDGYNFVPLGIFSLSGNLSEFYKNIITQLDILTNTPTGVDFKEEFYDDQGILTINVGGFITIPFMVSFVMIPNDNNDDNSDEGSTLTSPSAGFQIPVVKKILNNVKITAYNFYKQKSIYDRPSIIYRSYLDDERFQHAIKIYSVRFSFNLKVYPIIEEDADFIDTKNLKYNIEIKLTPLNLVAESEVIMLSNAHLFIPTPIYTNYHKLHIVNKDDNLIDFVINDDSKLLKMTYDMGSGNILEIKELADIGISINVISRLLYTT